MPKINGNEIRPGNVLEHNDGLWSAVKVDHVKPGKGVRTSVALSREESERRNAAEAAEQAAARAA